MKKIFCGKMKDGMGYSYKKKLQSLWESLTNELN